MVELRLSMAVLLIGAVAALLHADPESLAHARSLYQEGEYAAAAQEYEELLESGALTDRDHALLALAYARTDRTDAARWVARRAVAAAPADAFVVLAYANVLFIAGEYRLAEQHFAKAYELDASLVTARNGRVASLVNLAALAMGDGRLEEADRLVARALELDDDSVPALRALVALRREQGRDDGVLSALETLAVKRPRQPEIHVELGRRYLAAGREREAIESFLKAESAGTDDPFAYLYLAKQLRDGDDPEKTADRLHQAIGKAIQRGGAIQLQLARSLEGDQSDLTAEDLEAMNAQADRMDETAAIIDEALGLLREVRTSPAAFRDDLNLLRSWYPSSTHLKRAYGRLLEQQERWVEALEHWTTVAEEYPVLTEAHLGMARSHEELGQRREARLAYLRAVDREPKRRSTYLALERVYANEPEVLRDYLLDRYRIDNRNTVLLESLVRVERDMGLAEQAAEHAARIEELPEEDGSEGRAGKAQ